MPAPKRYWPGRCEFPLTEEYERGHAATFGEKADRYCEGCGRLNVWCECKESMDLENRKMMVLYGEMP